MRLLLWFTLFTICTIHFTQAGIYRRYVRRNRPRPMPHDRIERRQFQLYIPRPWPSFFMRRPRSPWGFHPMQSQPPRMPRGFRFQNERLDRVPHFHHQPTAHHYSIAPRMTHRHPSTTPFSAWRPLDYGNPIDRDPTFDYAPPAVERVRFISESNRRPTTRSYQVQPPFTHRPAPQQPPQGYSKRPSLWKMLAHKQRPKRPYQPHPPRQPQRYHGQNPNLPLYHHQVRHDEAEIFPNIPNMMYFQPTDVMSSSRRPGPMGFHRPPPGYMGPTTPMPGPISAPSDWKSPSVLTSPKKAPTILQAVKTTPVTITTTHNTAVKPFEPTESLEHHNHNNHRHRDDELDESAEESENIEEVVIKSKGSQNIKPRESEEEVSKLDKLDMVPPAPIFPNSFNILDSEKQDDDSPETEIEPEIEIPGTVVELPNDAKPRPVFNNAVKNPTFSESYKTSTSISVSVSKTDDIPTQAPKIRTTTSTPKPKASSTTQPSTTSTTTESTTPKPTKFPRLPTMPTYKKKPTPVYARKNKNTANGPLGKYSSSSSSSALAKEMNGSGEIVVITAGRSKVKEYKPQFIGDNSQLLSFDKIVESSSTSSSSDEVSTPSPPTTTIKSPLQEFDPMKLLHSWFTN